MNPKLVLSNYFDLLINQIDIHTEEELEKTKETDFIITDKPFVYELKPRNNEHFYFDFWKTDHDDDEKYQIKKIDYQFPTEYDYEFSHQPSKSISPGTVRVKDFLNETRDKMIAEVNAAQCEAFKRYDEIKDQLKNNIDKTKPQKEQEEEVLRHVFANQFLGLVRIDKIVLKYNKYYDNQSPFKLYLFKLDYFMDTNEQILFRYE